MITVTNLNDSGAGSLRQAIADAEAQAGADTIVFADTLTGGTITLQGALIFSQDELLIEGDISHPEVWDRLHQSLDLESKSTAFILLRAAYSIENANVDTVEDKSVKK